ncbi:MAG: PrsW family intramembrane metalloprotease [Thermoflexales bacterium]|nr:PrsW family intramembrane metalloprotease [Thermoflexales bacterium]
MNLLTGPMPDWLKRAIGIAGLLLALPGLPIAAGFCCLAPMVVMAGDGDSPGPFLFLLVFVALTVGAGGATFLHALRSLQGRPSSPLRLPAAWAMAGLFIFFVVTGLAVGGANLAPGLFFPPLLLVAAALPPLAAVAWFLGGAQAEGLTWRRGLVAAASGATAGVGIAIVLEILLPLLVLSLVAGLAAVVRDSAQALFDALAGQKVSAAITSPGFIFAFVQFAVIAPLAEELAKPLATLPLIGRLSRRDAFLVAATAGAGFAALENVLYAGFVPFWAGILVVRALGSAIHPLGAGLVGLGWRDVLNGEPDAWPRWLLRFGAAAGMHALWNGGSLLVITLAGARFFGELPPEIDVLGLSAAGTTLALLVVLGLAALWMGRAVAQGARLPGELPAEPVELEFALSNRTVAIWGLACLAAIVPAGIAGLQLLMK